MAGRYNILKIISGFLLVSVLVFGAVVYGFLYNFGAMTTIADLGADKEKEHSDFNYRLQCTRNPIHYRQGLLTF